MMRRALFVFFGLLLLGLYLPPLWAQAPGVTFTVSLPRRLLGRIPLENAITAVSFGNQTSPNGAGRPELRPRPRRSGATTRVSGSAFQMAPASKCSHGDSRFSGVMQMIPNLAL